MNFPWFKRSGIIFTPQNFIGWIIFVAGFGFAIYRFIEIDKKYHSVSDTLMNFIFNLLIIRAVYTLIAYPTSRVKRNKSTVTNQAQ
jgi:hypothetical protein